MHGEDRGAKGNTGQRSEGVIDDFGDAGSSSFSHLLWELPHSTNDPVPHGMGGGQAEHEEKYLVRIGEGETRET